MTQAARAARTPRVARLGARARSDRADRRPIRSACCPHVIEELAQSRGDAQALISARETLTYRALAERANRYARWALDQDLAKGETVCLMMPNRPDYMAIWLGITSVGGVVALINTQLRGPSLAHCIDIVAPRHVIVAAELIEQFRSARTFERGQRSGRTAAANSRASIARSSASPPRR